MINDKITPMTLWLTGRPCSGKTTIAKRLKETLEKNGISTACLDGDAIRDRLNADLGFSMEDRMENLRRVAHVAQMFNENGVFVVATFVSPTNTLRDLVRNLIGNFKLCYVDCSLEACEQRDSKGMYRKARLGQIKEFTGISAPFEEPDNAELTVNSEDNSLDSCVEKILENIGVLSRTYE